MAIHPRKFSLAILAFFFLAGLALAEGTRTWEQSKFDELVKGTARGVAIRSEGGLELASAFKALATTPSTYIWAIASDDTGALYAATGAPARIYRVTPNGQATSIFEPQELQVQALAVAREGLLYAATSPDGKVYKLERKTSGPATEGKPNKGGGDSSWTASMFLDPDTKYIWDLALDKAGNLFVATGDRGEIYRVTPKGERSLFFKSDEAHIRVLAFDPEGNLIAGSDGSGLVYRISASGEGFVLYSAPKKEITALAIDSRGSIYAAAVGEKRPGAAPVNFPAAMPAPAAAPAPAQQQPPGLATGAAPSTTPVMGAFPAPGLGAAGGSDVYRIAPGGSPTRLWTSREDIVYALAFDQQGRLLAGTGNRGHVFAIVGEDRFTDLVKASATQVTSFAKAPGGGLYASTSNLGKVFLLGPGPESEGAYESDIFDARIFSRWGRAELHGAGNIDLFVRSGNVDNPDRNWSPWEKVDLSRDAEVGVPSARFVQWKAVLRAGSPAPRVDSILLNYLPKNVAPDVDDVTVQVGVRYPSVPRPAGAEMNVSAGNPAQRYDTPPPAPVRDRDSIGVKWTARDDNDDQLVYSVYYRGDGETRWLLFKDGLSDKFFSFDAGLLPDGGYTIKVVASDALSHSPQEALSAEKESARFEVDTTPPRVENLAASLERDQVHVTFRATDSFSPIKRAEYSIDAGDWQFVEPVGQLSDSKTESYDFKVRVPADAADPAAKTTASETRNKKNTSPSSELEHVVVVRVYDRYDNMNAAKTVIRGK